MAYLEEIMTYKQNLMYMFLQSEEITNLIDNPKSESLSETNIFMYYYVPDTITTVGTYICFDVYAPRVQDRLLKNVELRIDIFSHQDSMATGLGYTRVDKLQSIIDKMLNGNKQFGIDEIELKSNVPLVVNNTHRGKTLYYQVLNFNQDKLKGTLEYEKQS